MHYFRSFRLRGYAVAISTVGIAFALKLLLKPWIGLEDTPFLLFFVSTIVSAWYGGMEAGVVATAMAAIISHYFFLSPKKVLLGNLLGANLQLVLFVLEGLFITVVVTGLQEAKRRAELNKLEAEYHQESLRQSEEGLRLLIAGVKDYAIYRLDKNGLIVGWNEAAQRIKGYRAEEIIGQHFSCFHLPEEILKGKPEQNLQVAAETGRFEEDGWRIRKDGSCFWANVVITALRDEAGNLQGFSKVTRDITERFRAEEERNQLLAREQATRAVAEKATEMVQNLQAIADAAIAPLSLDELLRELLNRISLILKTDTAAILLMDDENQSLVVRAAKGLEAEVTGEVRIRIGTGFTGRIAKERQPITIEQDAYTQVSSSILRDRGIQSLLGVPLLIEERLIGVLHVGTLLPRQFTNDDLQLLLLVAERAALAIERARVHELEIEALAHAQKANRVKDQFLAIVSHELRTPIQSILGWSQMLRSRNLNEETIIKALETIERNAKQQVKVINDILDVSRIVGGNIRLHLLPLHVVAVVEAAIRNARPAAEAKAIQMEFVCDRSVGFVSADPDRLHQIVDHMLANAIQFTPNGGCVTLRLENSDSYVQIIVSDTGEGISPEFLPHVFEGFRQSDNPLTRSHGGLGVGLTLVRYLVEMHGGTVHAASEGKSKGATFIVKLPMEKAQSRNGEKEMSNTQTPPANQELRSKRSISRLI